MLNLKKLIITIAKKQVVSDISLIIQPGMVHAIMGPNGSGKSSLAYALSGHPAYTIGSGCIEFQGIVLNALSPDVRSKMGIFLAMQQSPAIPGVSIFSFLKEVYQAHYGPIPSLENLKKMVLEYFIAVGLAESFLERSLHDGFSGGERKKFEIVQLLLLKPKLAILDEIDSGLDVDALKKISATIQYARSQNPDMSLILITHYQRILEYVVPDVVHVMNQGVLTQTGDYQLAQQIERQGYTNL